jgi:hypothetical protein
MSTFLGGVLVGVIVMVIYNFREEFWKNYCVWTGNFTAYRVVFPIGRYADFIAYSEEDRWRLSREIQTSLETGQWFSGGGAVISYTVIDGKSHDGRYTGQIAAPPEGRPPAT